MSFKQSFAAFAAALALTATAAAGTAIAQQPRSLPTVAAPLAADQTLGVAIMWAHVLKDGSLYDGAGVVESAKLNMQGEYVVKFNRSLKGCASSATAGNDAVIVAANPADLGGGYFGELIVLRDHAGSPYSGDFQLIVFCSR